MLSNGYLDHSGFTPHTLHLLVDLAGRLPFEEAAEVAANFGLEISSSELERLCAPIADACRDETHSKLLAITSEQTEAEPFRASPPAGRIIVLEIDGVMVLSKPELGECRGVEIKNVTLYCHASPSERWVMTDVRSPGELKAAIEGLILLAGVTPRDTLVGVGDGAAWVEDILDSFCCVSVTDCFHAAAYLDTVMLVLGWEEPTRSVMRRRLWRGKFDMTEFLALHLPTPEVWITWDEEALVALRYLEQRCHRMAYGSFKARGFPIGSGVIEGLNKSVVGTRMKRSGMQWSRAGAARMAAWRAFVTSKQKLVAFDAIRHRAFPPPSIETLRSSP